MFIKGGGNWVNLLNDALLTYNKNSHSTINMTPVDASNNRDKVRYTITSTKATPKYKLMITLGILIKVTFSLKDIHLIGIENCLKLTKFEKHNHQHKE